MVIIINTLNALIWENIKMIRIVVIGEYLQDFIDDLDKPYWFNQLIARAMREVFFHLL